MDEIKDLIKIVTDHTKRNVPLLDLKNQHSNGNKEMNLFLGLKNGDFKDDLEASNGIYGSKEVDFKFRMLKSRLSRKLLNHLFFMDFESKGKSRTNNLYQEALDYLHFSRMLLNVDEVSLGTKMLYKTIDLAEQCEFTTIALDGLKELRQVYAKTYRPKLFQNMKQRISELESLLQFEEEADALFQENALSINSSVNNRKRSVEPYGQAVDKLEELYTQCGSYNILERYIKLKIWCHELKGDHNGLLYLVADIEGKFKNGLINEVRFDSTLVQYAKGNALIKLRKFEEGRLFLQETLNDIDQTSKTWVSFAEQLLLLYLQNRQFHQAAEMFLRVTNMRSFNELDDKETLRWNIYRGYIHFLTGDKIIIGKFNYQSFIDNPPQFDKDNAGLNVALLILQFTSNLNTNFEILLEKIKAMDDYTTKHLNNSFSKRTKTFCKLLRKVVVYHGDHETILAKCKYLQNKLYTSQVAGNVFIDVEVVPYELLWENVLERLEKN